MKSKRLFNVDRREWLNKVKTGYTSYIKWNVEVYEYNKEELSIDANLGISDCYKRIDMSIDTHSDQARKDTLAKMDKLISELDTMRNTLSSTFDQYPIRKRVKPKSKGDKK